MIRRSYDDLIKRLEAIAASPNVSIETIGNIEALDRKYPLVIMHLGTKEPGKKGVMIAAGIHGDEPAGVEAVIRFLEENAENEALLSSYYFTIFPCNNPSGWELDTRENSDGIDINRQFAVKNPAPEAALITQALEGKCFDIVFEMHEDIDAPGFYLYEIADNPADHTGEAIIEAVQSMGYPINTNPCIEGMPAKNGLIRRKSIRFRKTRIPQAIYTYRTCGGHVLTLEPPASMLPLEDRIKIELIALGIVLKAADS